MKKFIKITQAYYPIFATLAAILALFSCSSEDGSGTDNSNSSVEYAFCVFVQDKICLNGPMTTCQGGVLSNSCPYLSSSGGGGSGTFTDSRNGKSYKFVNIGSQVWLAENLNYAAEGSKCGDESTGGVLSDANTAVCDAYGRLYDWATVMNLPSGCNRGSCSSLIYTKHQGICPSGWHIPTYEEWRTLVSFVEYDKMCRSCSNKYLKTSEWGGLDTYGFSALPGGLGYTNGNFSGVGNSGYWWTASENIRNGALFWYMVYNDEYGSMGKIDYRSYLFSVRCLQD